MGRKLHFLVSIIDKEDTSIYKAQRKGPSVCPGRPGGVWEGRRPVDLCLCVCLFIRNRFPGGFSLSPWPWQLGTCNLRLHPPPSMRQTGFKVQDFRAPGQGQRLCRQLSPSFQKLQQLRGSLSASLCGDAMFASGGHSLVGP